MPSRLPLCVLAALALLLSSCGEEKKPYKPAKYDYGAPADPTSVFLDDAPANRKASPEDLALAFVDTAGKKVALETYRDRKGIVLVVTRGIPQSPGGVFCPYCVAQVGSLKARYADFQKRQAEVLVVFPGPKDQVAEFIKQAQAPTHDAALPFPVLLDPDTSVCEKLGIKGDLAKPSTFILDKKGNVVYAYVGKTVTDRPSLKAILAQLDKLAAMP
jgi:peroxiredoxin